MKLNSQQLLDLENKVIEILKEVGGYIESKWTDTQNVSLKAHDEPVTEVDIEAEKRIRKMLEAALPEAGFIVEEGEDNKVDGYNWTIDPIDQTKNFIGKIPLFYTQAALLYNGKSVLGVIYNPISKQTVSASKGNGAKLNGNLVSKEIKGSLKDCIVDIDAGGPYESEWKFEAVKKLASVVYRIRVTSGALSTYMFGTGVDASLVFSETVKIVDSAPREVIYEELGLQFKKTEIDGHKVYISGHEKVVSEIEKVIS